MKYTECNKCQSYLIVSFFVTEQTKSALKAFCDSEVLMLILTGEEMISQICISMLNVMCSSTKQNHLKLRMDKQIELIINISLSENENQ